MKPFALWNYLFAGVVTVGSVTFGQAADVKVENYSNSTVYVARAENKAGGSVSHGWTAIKTNEVKTFTSPDNEDLYIRIQDDKGNEITFTKHKTFANFPTHNQRFTVHAEPDDAKVWVMKHGSKLEHSKNIKKGDKLPDGWESRRFFQIGKGSHKLEIKP